jgi:hypothetical protein
MNIINKNYNMENNSKTKSNNDKDNSSNNKSSNNMKGKRISFSQESEISEYTKENHRLFSPIHTYCNTNRQSSMRKIQKANKEFDDRYTTLKNRIEIIKREEQIYKNQLKNLKRQEAKEQMAQIDKIKLRLELSKIKEEQDKELEQRKERIHRFKEKIKNQMEEKKIENISAKKRKYQSALNDKYLIKCIIEQMNSQQINKKSYQHEKVRQYYNEYETNKIKKNLIRENRLRLEYENNMNKLIQKEKKMKRKCSELESVEKKYLEKLNETKENNLRYMENTSESLSKYSYVYFLKKGKLRNLNRSMELDSYSNDKKGADSNTFISCSMKNIKSKNEKNDKRDNTTTDYTQNSSISIFKNSKNSNKKNIKGRNSAKGRNNDSLDERPKTCRSVINIKENKKNIKIIKNSRNNNRDNIKKSNTKTENAKTIIKKDRNVVKFLTKKK